MVPLTACCGCAQDFQSEIARKDEEITRLNTELTASTEALERAQAAAQKAGRKRTMKGVGRGVVAAGRLATDHEKAGAFEIRPVRGDARPPSPRNEPQPQPQPQPEGTAAAAEPEQEKHTEAAKDAEARPTDAAAESQPADGAAQDDDGGASAGAGSEQQPAPHSSDSEMALRQEIVSLQSQLADMSAQAEDLHQQLEQQRRRPPPAAPMGKEGDPAAAVAAAVGEEGEWVSGVSAEEAAVREMIAMIKAAGHVTGLDTTQRRRGFALATASPTKQQHSPKSQPEDSMARKVASSYSSWSAASGREDDLSEAGVTATAIRTVWRSAGQADRPADGSEPAARFEAPVRSTEGRAALARLLTKKKRPASAGAARPRQLAAVGSSLDASTSSAQSGGGKRGSRRRPRSAQVRRPQPAARPDLVWGGLTDGLAT